MKINKFIALSIVFIAIAACISFFEQFFRDFLDDSIVVLIFYIFGIVGIILDIIALRRHKRESNKFSIYSVSLVTLIGVTILFLIVMTPCQCGSRSRARDARIVSAMYQLRLVAGDYYDDNYSYIGLEGDSEVITLKEDIIRMEGANFTINVAPDGKQYCAEVLTHTQGWYCVDNNVDEYYTDNPKCSDYYYTCE